MSLYSLLQDLRFALRQLGRAPVFALTAVLTLALGIGANTAIFSLLDQALLRSLPVRDPAKLVILEGTGTLWEGHSSSHGGDSEAYFSVPMYRDLRDQNHVFDGLIASAPADIGFSRNGHTEATRAELVSGKLLQRAWRRSSSRPTVNCSGRHQSEREPRRRSLLRLLARPPWRRSIHPRIDGLDQRPSLPGSRGCGSPLSLRHLG